MDLFFIQTFVYVFSEKGIQYGSHGDEYQHTNHAKEAAAQRNRCQYPDGVFTIVPCWVMNSSASFHLAYA